MPDRPRRLGKNPWGVGFGENDEAVLEVWVTVGGSGFDHCFHPGRLPWSRSEVVDQMRAIVLDFIDDGRGSERIALVTIRLDVDSGGCGHGAGRNASPSEQRPRSELLNEALRVLELPGMKTASDH